MADGRSIIVYPDGSFYEGKVSSSNQPYGKGIVRNSDGSIYYEGNWYHCYDPKIVWLCGPPAWYEYGEVFQLGASPFGSNCYVLYPAICLSMPASFKDSVAPAIVMFPHLQQLGCPRAKNCGAVWNWQTTPEKAVQFVGFQDLENYRKWAYLPDLRLLEGMRRMIEAAELGMKIFGFFPQGHEQGQGHNRSHTFIDKGLGVLKTIIEREIEKYYE